MKAVRLGRLLLKRARLGHKLSIKDPGQSVGTLSRSPLGHLTLEVGPFGTLALEVSPVGTLALEACIKH